MTLRERALEAARESFEQSFGPDHAWMWTQDDARRFAAAMLEFCVLSAKVPATIEEYERAAAELREGKP